MAAPAASVVDDFNRASLGSNWSTFGGAGTALAIGSSTLLIIGGANYCGSYYNAATYSRPCEAFITCVAGMNGTGNYFGLQLLTAPSGSSSNGYYIGSDTASSPDNMKLYRVDSGSETELASYAITNFNGYKFALQLDATHARLWADTGSGWSEVASAADTTHTGPFYATVDMYDPGASEVQLDNLAAGTIAAAVKAPPFARERTTPRRRALQRR